MFISKHFIYIINLEYLHYITFQVWPWLFTHIYTSSLKRVSQFLTETKSQNKSTWHDCNKIGVFLRTDGSLEIWIQVNRIWQFLCIIGLFILLNGKVIVLLQKCEDLDITLPLGFIYIEWEDWFGGCLVSSCCILWPYDQSARLFREIHLWVNGDSQIPGFCVTIQIYLDMESTSPLDQ